MAWEHKTITVPGAVKCRMCGLTIDGIRHLKRVEELPWVPDGDWIYPADHDCSMALVCGAPTKRANAHSDRCTTGFGDFIDRKCRQHSDDPRAVEWRARQELKRAQRRSQREAEQALRAFKRACVQGPTTVEELWGWRFSHVAAARWVCDGLERLDA